MICYRDITFCPFWERCKDGPTCHQALTDKVQEQAVIWWGGFVTNSNSTNEVGDAPICQYMNEPECFNHVE